MELPVKKLFEWKGEAGPAMTRVKKAMKWLLSPKAEGIVENQLREAYAIHKKPLIIHVTNEGPTAYYNQFGENEIAFNLEHNDKFVFTTAKNQPFRVSPEVFLTHEIEHTKQNIPTKTIASLERLQTRITKKVNTSPLHESLRNHLFHAKNTFYYGVANQRIEQATDTLIEMHVAIDEAQKHHPIMRKFIKRYEAQAVAVENKIATLRNEPARPDYYHAVADYEPYKPGVREQYRDYYDVEEKVGIPPLRHHAETWQEKIKNPSSLTFTEAEHPLIATHESGGKN